MLTSIEKSYQKGPGLGRFDCINTKEDGMTKKIRITLLLAIVGLAVVTGLLLSILPMPTARADHINIFDMNDRLAANNCNDEGSGVSVVDGNSVSFRIEAENLRANELYDLSVLIRVDGAAVADVFAMNNYQVPTDADGKLEFEKENFNLELLAPGDYRLDWMISHPDFTSEGQAPGVAQELRARSGRDPLLACQPATTLTISE